MESVCTRCGEVCNEPGARFCPKCGGRLEVRSGATAGPGPTVPPPAEAGNLPPVDPGVAAAIAGARCAIHPETAARDVCTRCGNFACEACVRADAEGRPVCAACASRVRLGHWDVPWEKRAELGLLRAYWQTAKTATFEPARAFTGLEPRGAWWDAMSYAMVSYLLSITGTFLLYGLVFAALGVFGLSQAHDGIQPLVVGGVAGAVIVGVAIAIPLGAIIRVYVGAGIDHLALKLAGGGKNGFDATMRTYCYAMSPAMFGLIPGCGIYIWEIWRIVLSIFGYRHVHGMSVGRATAAVLVPYGLCCGLYFLSIAGIQLAALGAHH